jgi:hypothetical protein
MFRNLGKAFEYQQKTFLALLCKWYVTHPAISWPCAKHKGRNYKQRNQTGRVVFRVIA